MAGPTKLADAGWPRPRAEWRGKWGSRRCPELPDRLPVPWINGPCVEASGDWHSFRQGALGQMLAQRLCLICGTPVVGSIFLAAQSHPDDWVTSGGGGHARCVLLAVKQCPHMVDKDYGDEDMIGWRWGGAGLGFLVSNPSDMDTHGDCDPVEPTAVPITLAELKAAARAER